MTRPPTKRVGALAFAAALLAAVPACADNGEQADDETTTTTTVAPSPVTLTDGPDAVAVITDSGQFGTFLGIVAAAGLTDTVAVGGPWTIFAPDDEALASLDAGAIDALRSDPEAARAFVLAHVVAGVWRTADLLALDGQTLTTEAATTISFSVVDGAVTIGGEPEGVVVVQPLGIESANAVVHALDRPLPGPA